MSIEVLHRSNLFTPAERRAISHYWHGNTSDKAIARAENISPDTVRERFKGIQHKLHMPYGSRREQAMLKALSDGLIDIQRKASAALCLLLTLFSIAHQTSHQADDYARLGKLRRNPIVRTTRQRRNNAFDSLLANIQEHLSL